jgi:hypothetical protein
MAADYRWLSSLHDTIENPESDLHGRVSTQRCTKSLSYMLLKSDTLKRIRSAGSVIQEKALNVTIPLAKYLRAQGTDSV